MKEYNPDIMKIKYHPDDTPELFLSETMTYLHLEKLKSSIKTQKDQDTFSFIKTHEETQRNIANGLMNREEQKIIIDNLAKEFLIKYGDWVHHINPLYWKFYNSL